ncbi:MAG: YlxR family protein [Ilumatobacteraceae bacterium]
MVTTQELDPRPNQDVRVPVRMCIGCRSHRPQAQLIRCTLGSDGPAVSRTSSGRGAWLCSIACFDTAVRRNAFGRAWRCDVPGSTLGALRIPFERVITNMKDLSAAGTISGAPMPTKG